MKYDLLTNVAVSRCFVLSMFTGIGSSIIAMLHKYERHLEEDCEFIEHKEDPVIQFLSWIMGLKSPFMFAVTQYKFLPIFLLLAYVAFLVERWRKFMIVSHTIQGRLHDLGAIIGSIPGKNVSDEEKAQLYKLYRLMNTMHILLYHGFLRQDFKHENLFPTLVNDLGLLTQNEADAYVARGIKLRDSLTSNLMTEICELIKISNKRQEAFVKSSAINSQLLESKSVVAHQKACALRGEMAKFVDLSIRDNPNEYILAMRVVVELLKVLIMFGYPVLMFAESSADYNCFQPLAIFGTLFILMSLTMPFILFERLANPFDAVDDIRAEHLCASTELCLFQSLRSQYCDDVPSNVRSTFESIYDYDCDSSYESSCTFLPSVKDEQKPDSHVPHAKKVKRRARPPRTRLEKFLQSINHADFSGFDDRKAQLELLKSKKGKDNEILAVPGLTNNKKKSATTHEGKLELLKSTKGKVNEILPPVAETWKDNEILSVKSELTYEEKKSATARVRFDKSLKNDAPATIDKEDLDEKSEFSRWRWQPFF